ncbi:hypothetical protein ACFYUD_22715 [Nocardia tengchongensis]|uniref:hypothetical protein n=1 Tax=Nocardia tengchongensis TaxID=2055889 RepID=UPI0036A6A947
MFAVRSCLPALTGLALLASTAACSGTESAAPATSAAPAGTTTATPTPSVPATSGALPPAADAQGWRDSSARCGAGERLVLLIGSRLETMQRLAVCEEPGGPRVLRADVPQLRAQPFEAKFFTFTANSQQFLAADGMKLDLSRQMVTVADDPQMKRGVVQSFTVGEYWSSF